MIAASADSSDSGNDIVVRVTDEVAKLVVGEVVV